MDTRGSSAPADADGWIVERRPLLKLLVRAMVGFRFDSGACCPEAPRTMLESRPGPTDLRGALTVEGAGTEVVFEAAWVMELCRRSLRDETVDCVGVSFAGSA